MFNLIKTKLSFKTKEDALKFHLFAISQEEGLKLSPADIDVAIEIYVSGYNKELFLNCVSKGYFKSEQTVKNSVAKLTKCGILNKSRGNRKVSPNFLPAVNGDYVFVYNVSYENKN
jgi:predicted transcriptional regulator